MVFGAIIHGIGAILHFFWDVLAFIFHFCVDVVVAIVTTSWSIFVTIFEALRHIFTFGRY